MVLFLKWLFLFVDSIQMCAHLSEKYNRIKHLSSSLWPDEGLKTTDVNKAYPNFFSVKAHLRLQWCRFFNYILF